VGVTSTIVNVEQARAWDGDEGRHWAAHAGRYDRAVTAFHVALLGAASIVPDDAVLDIGCGCGQSTRDAARLAFKGRAHGIDLSASMLQHAREQAERDGIGNVTFEQGDAQVHPIPPESFDVAMSRFGAMFFSDIGAAFANVAGGLRRGGRIAVAAWTSLDRNDWIADIRHALLAGRDLPAPPPGVPGPFGLSDPASNRQWLNEAGFAAVDLREQRGPFYVGDDADDAFEFMSATGMVRGMLDGLDAATSAAALGALRETFRAHQTADGVVFHASAWIITAIRR
jgi:ubiquinone/menaquinone biosynthesis C-methylase UbiE